jgi:hypothetical protein
VPANPGLDVSGTLANNPRGIEDNFTYNDRDLQLSVAIPAGYTAPNGGWWSIKYTATGAVNDRTTWSVTVGPTSDSEAGSIKIPSRHHAVATRGHHKKRAVTSHRRQDLGAGG